MTDRQRRERDDYDHLGIAEQGKLLALKGDHVNAMAHYREAMRRAVAKNAPELFFRHYLECSLESLEHMGSFDNVLEYCRRAISHYEKNPPEHVVARRDLASIYQRYGINLLKSGDRDSAKGALERALEHAAPDGGALPLATVVLGWLKGGLHVTAERLRMEQRNHEYFSVRQDTVDHRRATGLTVDSVVTAASMKRPEAR